MAALFVLVVLAVLGAVMVTLSNAQQVDAARDLQGSRAYWAARAGLEWAIGSLAGAPAACPAPPSPFTVEGFTLTITCSRNSYDEAGATRVIYSLGARAATAGAVGDLGFVERSVSASVEF